MYVIVVLSINSHFCSLKFITDGNASTILRSPSFSCSNKKNHTGSPVLGLVPWTGKKQVSLVSPDNYLTWLYHYTDYTFICHVFRKQLCLLAMDNCCNEYVTYY